VIATRSFTFALQHRPRFYIRLGFVPIGEVDEVSARLNLIAGTQT
jgi:hypothetical protein